ncbi:SMP-30/Gluconolaconase/LRE-like region-domain-containing protein [Hypoxylon trugodes]|uniref:SMP-30/Gluconolaconase/LRE-like region-domain-containing protein n=1 Tax=Hypoxylon trugodes TaxID=326681 RepID=UPI00218F8134|nr:SMP-30/Gluconolaconase/LRE-like region-domain-containing protein [Hypoxylon trugodes]KAI1393435.1 SMP-30/Gluconolaconase/LRE-like region-domain-containing protein [Hypoxylon trugodes]
MSTTEASKPPAGLQQWHATAPFLHLHCELGEGPYYEAATHKLRFVDIKKKRVHAVDLNAADPASAVETIQLDTPVTVTADIDGVDPRERILIGAKYGIAELDRRSGRYEYLARFSSDKDDERLRSNDGAVDPHGRFWLGTMTDIGLDLQPEGSVFLFDGTRTARSMRHPVTIPNSVGWSPDGRTQYFTHSTERTIFASDYDPVTGDLTNERKFYVHDGPGEPDGFRVDTEGNLWQAVYGEARVLKISPEGNLVGQVNLPTRNCTCTQFVGTELFVTSAAMHEGQEGTDKEFELGGGLFRVEVGARGLEPFLFKVSKAVDPES